MMIMSVYIIDEDNETAWLRGQGPGRDESMFGGGAVDPDYGVAI